MKKSLAILLALLLVFSLAACGGAGDDTSTPSSSFGESSAPEASVPETSEPETSTPESSEPGTSEPDASTTTEGGDSTTDATDKTTTTKKTSVGDDKTTIKKPSVGDKTTTTQKPFVGDDKTTTTKKPVVSDKTTTTTKKPTTTKRPTTTKKPMTTTKTTTVTTTTTTKATSAAIKDIVGSSADEKSWVYEIVETGLHVRETTIDSGKGGKPVEIVQISDLHFNAINDKDRQENNPTIMGAGGKPGMYDYRTNLKDGAIRTTALRCLNYAKHFDQTVVTGDSIDYLTHGAMQMVKDVIWGTIPTALVTLGNHDMVRDWGACNQAGVPKDTSTLESRYQILQDNWKHDIYYTSKVVGNKAMVIQLDNGNSTFHDSQVTKLQADVETARQKGYVVLLFCHIPISNNNSAQKSAKVIRKMPGGAPGIGIYKPSGLNETAATKAIYNIVFNNADVIRGVFAGHTHEDVYYEISAKTPDGTPKTIPHIVLTSPQYFNGTVMKITVK